MNLFDDIRSFRDDEIPAAMQRIANDAALPAILDYLDFGMDVGQFQKVLCNIKTVKEFQTVIVKSVVERILQRTTDGLSVLGIENLNPETHYMFVSNHRDIVLDAMLMNYALLMHGFPLFNIAFGNNLVFNDFGSLSMRSGSSFALSTKGCICSARTSAIAWRIWSVVRYVAPSFSCASAITTRLVSVAEMRLCAIILTVGRSI